MSAYEKERIFVELREYHLHTKEKFATDNTQRLAKEFTELEENAINMMLSFINGKAEYVDMMGELKTLKDKISDQTKGSADEAEDREYLFSKIDKLKDILDLAAGSSFKVRPQRYRGTLPRNTSGITTTSNK